MRRCAEIEVSRGGLNLICACGIHEAAEVLTSKVTMKLGMTDCGRGAIVEAYDDTKILLFGGRSSRGQPVVFK